MVLPMDFYSWFLQLAQDAAKHGCSRRLNSHTFTLWAKIWSEGVTPSVAAVCAWATGCPERFEDLRESESDSDFRMAA
jgi:hypothetical protein